MRKAQKKQAEEFVLLLAEAHDEIKKAIEARNGGVAMDLLVQCQEGAIKLGELIETTEGEGFITIPLLENYCELVYQVYEAIAQNQLESVNQTYKTLRKSLIQIENSVRNDIPVRLEVVFLPYKASMWDSLESVWKAAEEDENCDAYVVPIPYYDRKPDGAFGAYHYEGKKYPSYVPIIHYDDYDFEKRRPDIVYIHNPYDNYNMVTSVDPRFYSFELKKYTDMLVYIPYYSTTGGMSEGQYSCSAYYHADYIIIQAEKYRKFFDADLPQKKLVALGSPKFDRVINACKNPPQPPAEWKTKMAGKKVYFYNTSIGGMLADTEVFLKKMKYVFECFMNREDACLLWRPHPLLESTLESMRAGYKPVYTALKNYFVEHNLGIYDTTPDVTNTIALCDAYIGDAGSSVVSLFGMAGKPTFILNNNIHTEPEEDDWRGEIIKGFFVDGDDNWMITQGNKLYHSPDNDYKYKYCCDLSEYASGGYYSFVISIGEKQYACPANAQDIVVLKNGKIEKRIQLEQCVERQGAFAKAIAYDRYLFLIPNNYPAIVRYDTEKEEIQYLKNGLDVFRATVEGKKRIGGFCVQDGYLFLASPIDNRVLVINIETGKEQILTTKAKSVCGCIRLVSDGTDLWFLPYSGYTITRWNPHTGEMQEYTDYPKELKSTYVLYGQEREECLFGNVAFCGRYAYFSPAWANMYVRLDKTSGEMTKWMPPFEIPEKIKNGYFFSRTKSGFIHASENFEGKRYLVFSILDRKYYEVNLETQDYKKIEIQFDLDELKKNEAGFQEISEWLKYACEEGAFNSLPDFLGENITGHEFNREKQIHAYAEIATNTAGNCGEKIHEFVCSKV